MAGIKVSATIDRLTEELDAVLTKTTFSSSVPEAPNISSRGQPARSEATTQQSLNHMVEKILQQLLTFIARDGLNESSRQLLDRFTNGIRTSGGRLRLGRKTLNLLGAALHCPDEDVAEWAAWVFKSWTYAIHRENTANIIAALEGTDFERVEEDLFGVIEHQLLDGRNNTAESRAETLLLLLSSRKEVIRELTTFLAKRVAEAGLLAGLSNSSALALGGRLKSLILHRQVGVECAADICVTLTVLGECDLRFVLMTVERIQRLLLDSVLNGPSNDAAEDLCELGAALQIIFDNSSSNQKLLRAQ